MDDESRQTIYKGVVNYCNDNRFNDYWGWYSKDKLGLILPETNEMSAKTVVTRLKNNLCIIPELKPHENALRNGRFSVIEYPKILQENIIWELSKKTDDSGFPENLRLYFPAIFAS